MPVPCLIIGGIDYAAKCLEVKPANNGLTADGAGRDIQTGEMFREKIGDKMKWDVSMDDLDAAEIVALDAELRKPFYYATILNPTTNARTTGQYFTENRPFGSQVYNPFEQKTVYKGMTFTMTEK